VNAVSMSFVFTGAHSFFSFLAVPPSFFFPQYILLITQTDSEGALRSSYRIFCRSRSLPVERMAGMLRSLGRLGGVSCAFSDSLFPLRSRISLFMPR
jgi:hypothetical protein